MLCKHFPSLSLISSVWLAFHGKRKQTKAVCTCTRYRFVYVNLGFVWNGRKWECTWTNVVTRFIHIDPKICVMCKSRTNWNFLELYLHLFVCTWPLDYSWWLDSYTLTRSLILFCFNIINVTHSILYSIL